jgi:hypothetical protein
MLIYGKKLYHAVVGPFKANPFIEDMAISALNSVPKKDFLVCFICHTELIDNLSMLSHSVKCGQAEELSG